MPPEDDNEHDEFDFTEPSGDRPDAPEAPPTDPDDDGRPPPEDPPVEQSEPEPDPATHAAALSTTLNPRLAPQSLEAERSVLGGVLLANEEFWNVCELVSEQDFYREPHRQIWLAMFSLMQRSEPIDMITLPNELTKMGVLEAVGGLAYIVSLDASVPATANLSRYAKIVREKAVARRLIEAAHDIARKGYEQQGTLEGLLNSAEQQISDVTEQKTSVAFTPLGVSVKRVFEHLEGLYENPGELTGVPTGFDQLDRMTCGLQKGDLIIVAARPMVGKTSCVMNMAAHVAIEKGLPVAVFSLEMSADALTTRLFSSEARVDGQRLRSGKLLDSDWPKLARVADRLFRAPMYIDDSAALSIMEMRAKCRRLKAKHSDLGLVVVDYLQLMKGRTGGDNREQEISEISRGLKALAKELQVPVVALSQLNRGLERREDKRPQLSDLRESGAIEQDADLICFIYRDEVYNRESADKGIAEIIVGKQRNGPTGTVRVAFLKDYTRFENLAEDRNDHR